MSTTFANKKIATWPIAKLRPHPRQGVFCAHTQAQVNDLADSLKREKLISPVEITPDGTIICGHGRVAAAAQLGWRKIHCWVRHDLAEQGADAIFRRLVEDNLHRRQLSKLGLGRAFIALKKQEYDTWRTKDQEQVRGDFRDYLGAIMGCDGTTAERWAKLAVLPHEYDHLIEANLLSQQQAARIVKHLPSDIREKLGKKLTGIATADLERKEKKRKVRAAVDARLGSRTKAVKQANPAWQQALSAALGRVAQDPPARILELVDHLERNDGVQSLMMTLQREYPQTIRELSRMELDLSQIDSEQLRRSVLILGVLHAADAYRNRPL